MTVITMYEIGACLALFVTLFTTSLAVIGGVGELDNRTPNYTAPAVLLLVAICFGLALGHCINMAVKWERCDAACTAQEQYCKEPTDKYTYVCVGGSESVTDTNKNEKE